MNNVLDELEKRHHTTIDYPMAEFIIVFGFFLVLIIEQVVLDCKERWLESDSIEQHIHTTNSFQRNRVILQDSHDEIDENSSLIRGQGEPLSATLAREQILASSSTYRGKLNENSNLQKSYGSTTTNSLHLATDQQLLVCGEESVQKNNNAGDNW